MPGTCAKIKCAPGKSLGISWGIIGVTTGLRVGATGVTRSAAGGSYRPLHQSTGTRGQRVSIAWLHCRHLRTPISPLPLIGRTARGR